MQNFHDINPHLLILFTKDVLSNHPTSFMEIDHPSKIYNTQDIRKEMSRERAY